MLFIASARVVFAIIISPPNYSQRAQASEKSFLSNLSDITDTSTVSTVSAINRAVSKYVEAIYIAFPSERAVWESTSAATISLIFSEKVAAVESLDELKQSGKRNSIISFRLLAPSIRAISSISRSTASIASQNPAYAVGIMTRSDTTTGATAFPSQIAKTSVTAIVGSERQTDTTGESNRLVTAFVAASKASANAITTLITNDNTVLPNVPERAAYVSASVNIEKNDSTVKPSEGKINSLPAAAAAICHSTITATVMTAGYATADSIFFVVCFTYSFSFN